MIYNFKYKIQEIMGWDNSDFDLFLNKYERCLASTTSTGIRRIYTPQYIQMVLSLFFFVYAHRVTNKKAFLIALILNGLYDDSYNLQPNEKQTLFNKTFFAEDLTNLLDDNTKNIFEFLCDPQEFNEDDFSKLYFDYLLFNDFRLVFKAIKVSDKGYIIYISNPNTIVHPRTIDIKDPEVLESFDIILEQICNLNMKDLYKQKIEAYKDFTLT